MDKTKIFSEEQVAIAELPQDISLFDEHETPTDYDAHYAWDAWEEGMIRHDPVERGLGDFFVYASCHWLEHFGTIMFKPFSELGQHRGSVPSGLNSAW
ncbi:hypothetical protein ACJZ2D_007943 [Fusarium nematophilum]